VGWGNYVDQDKILLVTLVASAGIISVLLGFCVSSFYRIRKDATKMASIFSAMSDFVLEIDPNGSIIWIAPSSNKLPASINHLELGLDFFDKLSPYNREKLEKAVAESRAEKSIIHLELQFGENPNSTWLNLSLSPKNNRSIIIVFRETTHEKEQAQKLVVYADELAASNTHKDRLFSILAHDLRTPLSAITGLSEHLLHLESSSSDEKRKEFTQDIFECGQENLRLLENLLAWAQSQQNGFKLQLETFDLHSLLQTSIQTFRKLASLKAVSINNNVPVGVKVVFDRAMLDTIFRNLISNAIKFSNAGATIEIGTSVPNATDQSDKAVELFFKDTGVGLDARTLGILNHTKTTASTKGTSDEVGTGLGIPLCHEFLEKHEQSMRFESLPGAGTTVYITLERA